MPLPRRTFAATATVALLAAAGVTAAVAADPAPAPPPAIAFLANGRVPADALAAGPIAGQLGAPIYTTEQASLPDSTATALDTGDPELVIVLGGPVAISDHVIDQVETATGLAATDQPTPAGGIVRAAGPDRFATAAAVADLLAAYDPAYLPVTAQAVDADTLDGKHASAFVEEGDPIDAETLDGTDGSDFARGLFAVVDSDGTVRAGSHLTTTGNVHVSDGWYVLEFDPGRDLLRRDRLLRVPQRHVVVEQPDHLRDEGRRQPQRRPGDGGRADRALPERRPGLHRGGRPLRRRRHVLSLRPETPTNR